MKSYVYAAFCYVYVALAAGAARADAAALFNDGNAAYLAGENGRAAAAYEAIVAEGVASREVETNLGAAYLRQGKRGLAALHFERALALAPSDDDARADLAELRRTNVDKLEGGDEPGAADIFTRLLAPLPGPAASWLAAIFWTVAFALVSLAILRPPSLANRPLGAFAIAAFALAVACGAVASGAAAGHAITLRRAVVTAPSAAAHEGPSSKSASPFEVHEGTTVSIEEELSGYSRIKLANGLTGWVDSHALERVLPPAWRL